MTGNLKENKKALLKEFKSLNTIKKKLEFWENKLGMNYLTFLADFNNQDTLHDFQIIDSFDKSTNIKPHWEELNLWILKNFENNNPKTNNYYLNISFLKKQFNEDLRATKNKAEAILKEIRTIDESFRIMHSPFNRTSLSSGVMWNFTYNADHKAYTDFLNYGLSPDYSELFPGLHIIRYANGKILAEYRAYINSLLKKYPVNSNNINEDVPLTSKQIALLIYYTGLLDSENDNITYAKVFSGLLSINYKNLYDDIRERFNWRDAKNLQAVLIFMEKNKLKPSAEFLSDLKKASK